MIQKFYLKKGYSMNFKHIMLMNGLIVCTVHAMEKESKLIPITSLTTVVPYNEQNISLENLICSRKPRTKEMKKAGIKNCRIELPVYIETSPHSVDNPRMETTRNLKAATLLAAIKKGRCFYCQKDEKIIQNIHTEKYHVPHLLITKDPKASKSETK